MDTEAYRIFLSIAEYKSFQKAAEIHSVTPPAVSHTIRQMEESYGFPLFIRSRHGVELTSSGQEVCSYIRDIVSLESRLNQAVAQLNGMDRGHVKLGIFNSMCCFLPDLIHGFHSNYPHITFEIFQGSYEDIIEWLKDGTVDIGFLSKTVNPGFCFYEIFSDPLMCIFNKNEETPGGEGISLEELSNRAFIMQRESCDADARRIMDKMNLDIRTVCHVVDDKTTVEMVKAGFGFAIMPRLTMKDFEDEVKMLPIVPVEKRVIGVTVRNEQDLTLAVKKFYQYAKEFSWSCAVGLGADLQK